MNIAIIGAGNVGKALGSSLIRTGHEVTIAAASAESAQAAATEIGSGSSANAAAAADGAQIVILAVPYAARDSVAAEIAGVTDGSVIIDVTNPINADYSGLATDGTSAAEELQRLLPKANVVKAFNTIFATNQADPKPEIDGYVAGDDAKAKQTVIDLVTSLGFTPLDVGPLSSARHLEGMAWVNIGFNMATGGSWSSAWRLQR